MADSPEFRLTTLPAWAAMDASAALVAALGPGVRFVGGCVRDTLVGAAPADLDLATPDEPSAVLDKLAKAGIKAIPTGIAHGTVTALVRGRQFEITTLRRDVETDGRHAVVEFTRDWRADAARRDFTINAMSLDPHGALYDYFGGRADLAAGRVRFVGDPALRIAEDVLRVLRFFRFHARFGAGAPDAAALAACRAAAGTLPGLSAERVRGELFRLLEGPRAPETLETMRSAGLFAHWLPELGGVEKFANLRRVAAKAGARVDAVLALASLLPAAAAAPVAERLKLSNADAARLAALLAPAASLDPRASENARRAAFYRLGGDPAPHVLLAWAARPDDADHAALFAHAAHWVRPKFPLTGADARDAGLEPGPAMGAWLKEREEAWIEAGCR
jgi:poly(A) polymerase